MLSDHKQIGKRFIPPLLDFAGTDVNSLEKISWINCRLPELLWLGLLKLINDNSPLFYEPWRNPNSHQLPFQVSLADLAVLLALGLLSCEIILSIHQHNEVIHLKQTMAVFLLSRLNLLKNGGHLPKFVLQ